MIGAEQLKQEDLKDIKTITVKDNQGALVGTIVALNLGDSVVIQAGTNITLEVDETNKTLTISAIVPDGTNPHAENHITDADRIPDATQLEPGLMSVADKIKVDNMTKVVTMDPPNPVTVDGQTDLGVLPENIKTLLGIAVDGSTFWGYGYTVDPVSRQVTWNHPSVTLTTASIIVFICVATV